MIVAKQCGGVRMKPYNLYAELVVSGTRVVCVKRVELGTLFTVRTPTIESWE